MIPVVGFYTKDTPYYSEAIDMRASAKSVGISEVVLYAVENKGSWERNCQLKAEVLLNAAEELKRPFLYVDADARFEKPPTLFDIHWHGYYDIGIHFFQGAELLTGTIWVNPTLHTKRVLCDWIALCEKMPGTWDQKVLERVLGMQTRFRVLHLPPEYTWIYDLSQQHYGERSPVIVHYQASRRYKRTVKT